MRDYLIQFLKALEAAIPPPLNCHHAITYAQYGSDSAGWKEQLSVQVNVGGKFYAFFVEDGDFEKGADALAAEIAGQVGEAVDKTTAQKGVALGQYIGGDPDMERRLRSEIGG